MFVIQENAFYSIAEVEREIEQMGVSWAEFRDCIGLSEIVTGGIFGFQILTPARDLMYGMCAPPAQQCPPPPTPMPFDPPDYENPGQPPKEES